MTVTCYIIDDEPLAIKLLEGYVRKTPFLELAGSSSNPVKALEDILKNTPDLIFLDIQMPELNGLDFSRMVGDRSKIIFTTAFEQYAVESYRLNALDYLMKPIPYSDFLNAAEKALVAKSNKTDASPVESIFVKSDYKLKKVEIKDIQYIEGRKDYVKIHLEGKAEPVTALMSLKGMEELLPDDKFMRVHRSFIVNIDKVKVIERNRIVFGKEYIPISDSLKGEFIKALSKNAIIYK